MPDPSSTRRSFLRTGAVLSGAATLGLHGAIEPRAHAAGAPASVPGAVVDEDGSELWLRYRPLTSSGVLSEYRRYLQRVVVDTDHEFVRTAADELGQALGSLLSQQVPIVERSADHQGSIILGTWEESATIQHFVSRRELERLGPDGFVLRKVGAGNRAKVVIGSIGSLGVLYGAFHLLRLLQTSRPRLRRLDEVHRPALPIRMLNHWDNLDGSVERGYAGGSIFWSGGSLIDAPDRHRDYGRALASVGINGVTVSNVNATRDGNADLLSPAKVDDLAELAGRLRPYGVKIYLSPSFASPILVGGLSTADPLDNEVAAWWRDMAAQLKSRIPNFGGLVIKADSEGQPGPNTYGRTHLDGANMLAEAFGAVDATVYWRAFVYEASDTDRAKQAYEAFLPFDGQFASNVAIQVKNGPVDFQVREPVSPLFGLSRTNLALELQITQEYTGQSTHLCYLPTQWASYFATPVDDQGNTLADRMIAQAASDPTAAVIGVANVGTDTNWTGHALAAANLYGFGRMAWDPSADPTRLGREWGQQTFDDAGVVAAVSGLLDESWATYERYTSPLGVGFMCDGAHFDPSPETRTAYHHADSDGVGYDRTQATGSGYTGQYPRAIAQRFDDLATIPEEHLLFFHHMPYRSRLRSGPTVIQWIYDTHYDGADEAATFVSRWAALSGRIDGQRHAEILERFRAQERHAKVWRDSIVGYFRDLSGIPDEKGRI